MVEGETCPTPCKREGNCLGGEMSREYVRWEYARGKMFGFPRGWVLFYSASRCGSVRLSVTEIVLFTSNKHQNVRQPSLDFPVQFRRGKVKGQGQIVLPLSESILIT